MNENQCRESRLNSLWNINGNKRYSLKKFVNNGKFVTHIVFKDKYRDRDVIGKVVTTFSEGEVFHWPRLHHRCLAPLLDVVSIHANISVLISTHNEKNLRGIIHNEDFANNPRCFANKKNYMEDVLWGLDYLHRNSLVLMNISDANVYICLESNKAVITDLSSIKSVCHAKKLRFPLSSLYQAPEVSKRNYDQDKGQTFNPIAAEMWAFGVMALEVFLQHRVPWALVDYDCSRAIETMNYIDLDILRAANRGSIVLPEDLMSFKEFAYLFLASEPYNRCDARHAALATFLKPSKRKMVNTIPNNCGQQCDKGPDKKVSGDDISVKLNSELSLRSPQEVLKIYSQQVNQSIEGKVTGNSSVGLNDLSSMLNLKSSSHQINYHVKGKETGHMSVEFIDLPSTKSSNKLYSSKYRITPTVSEKQFEISGERILLNTSLSAKTSTENLQATCSFSMYEGTCRNENASSIRKVHSSNYPYRKSNSHKQKCDDGLTQQISENTSDRRWLHSLNRNLQQKPTQSAALNQRIENPSSHKKLECDLNLNQSKGESFYTKQTEQNKEIRILKSSFLNLNNEAKHHSSEDDNEAFENDQLSHSRTYCSRSKSMFFDSFKQKSCKSYISLQNSHPSKRDFKNAKEMKDTIKLIQSDPILGDSRNISGIEKSDTKLSTINIKRRKSQKNVKRFNENESGQTEQPSFRSQLNGEENLVKKSKQKEEEIELKAVVLTPFELTGKLKSLPETTIENSRCIFRNRFHCPIHSKIESSNKSHQNKKHEQQNCDSVEVSKKFKSLHPYKSDPLSNCYYSQILKNSNPSNNSIDGFLGNNKFASFETGNFKCNKRYSYRRAVNGDGSLSDLMSVDGFTLKRLQSVEKQRKKKKHKRPSIQIEVVSQNCCKTQTNDRQTLGTVTKTLKNGKIPKDCSKQKNVKCHAVKTGKKNCLPPNAEDNSMRQEAVTRRSLTILTTETQHDPSVPTLKDYSKQKKSKYRAVKTGKKNRLPPNAEDNSIRQEAVTRRSLTILTTETQHDPSVPTSKDYSKQKKSKYRAVKRCKKNCLPPHADKVTSQEAVISRTSLTILAAETLNIQSVPTNNNRPKDKRKSFKKSALYLLCLGDE